MPVKSKTPMSWWLSLGLGSIVIGIILYLVAAQATSQAPARYVVDHCADGVTPEVCVLVNALKYDYENWVSNDYGVNNTRLHVGVWMANKSFDIYYNTGSDAHLLAGLPAPKLEGADLEAFTRAMGQFMITHQLDERGKFRRFMLRPR